MILDKVMQQRLWLKAIKSLHQCEPNRDAKKGIFQNLSNYQ